MNVWLRLLNSCGYHSAVPPGALAQEFNLWLSIAASAVGLVLIVDAIRRWRR